MDRTDIDFNLSDDHFNKNANQIVLLQRLNLAREKAVRSLCGKLRPMKKKALGRYKGWPHLYRKEMMKVKVDKKTVNAMVHIMNEGRPLDQPSCYYYSTILEGYQSAGFDVEYLRRAVEDSDEKGAAT